MSEIYKRIKMRRQELGLTIEELAKKMGYKDKSSISKIENGKADIPQSKVVAFARALNTTTSYLVGADEISTHQNDMNTDKTRNQEIKAFFDDVLNDVPSSFRVRFATVLARLSSDQWQLIADMANKLVEECKEENDNDD